MDAADLCESSLTEKVTIMLTEKCNLRCVFCHQVAWDAEKHERIEFGWEFLQSIIPVQPATAPSSRASPPAKRAIAWMRGLPGC